MERLLLRTEECSGYFEALTIGDFRGHNLYGDLLELEGRLHACIVERKDSNLSDVRHSCSAHDQVDGDNSPTQPKTGERFRKRLAKNSVESDFS